jgi:hypothetical protein
MDTERRGDRVPRVSGLVLAGVAGTAVIALAFVTGQDSRDQRDAGQGPALEAPPAPDTPAPAVPGGDPVLAAQEWLRAFRTVAYTDPAATSWAERVRPVVIEELAQEVSALEDADGGVAWVDFVARQCRSATRDVSAVVPEEAPRAASNAFVQVSGEVVTDCAGEPEQVEPVAATVEVQRGPDGLWRVAKRLF